MRRGRWGGGMWIVAAVGFVVLEARAAAAFEPTYSYATNYISDLGLPGSPRASLMHAGFYLQALLFSVGGLLIVGCSEHPRGRAFLGLLSANAAGNVVIATVHRGPWHVAGAALAILGGNLAILVGTGAIGVIGGPRWYRAISKVLAVLGLASLAILLVGTLPAGVWERGSVYSITLWQLLTGAWLLVGPGQADSSTG